MICPSCKDAADLRDVGEPQTSNERNRLHARCTGKDCACQHRVPAVTGPTQADFDKAIAWSIQQFNTAGLVVPRDMLPDNYGKI